MRTLRLTLLIAAVIVVSTAAGATASTLITGRQIKNESLTGKDVRNGSIRAVDLDASARRQGPAGPKGDTGTQGIQGTPGPASIHLGRFSEVGTADPGTTNQVTLECPHGQVVTVTHRIIGQAEVTGVTLHDTTAMLTVRNDSADPVTFIGTVTCVDTQPY